MDTRDPSEGLSPRQCLTLLGGAGIGRVAFSQRALPAIVSVGYDVVDDEVMLRLSSSAPELASLRDAVVAFQSEGTGTLGSPGWWVSCVGRSRLLAPPRAATAYLRLEPQLWQGRLLTPAAAPAS